MTAATSTIGFAYARPACLYCPRPAAHSVVVEDGWYPICDGEVPGEVERLKDSLTAHIEFDTYEPIPYLLTETAYEILRRMDLDS